MSLCKGKLKETPRASCVELLPGALAYGWFTRGLWIDAFPGFKDYETSGLAADAYMIDGDITFDTTTYPEAGWYQYAFLKDSLDVMEETLGGTDVGKYESTVVPFKMPGINGVILHHFAWLKSCPDLIMMYPSKSGLDRVVGNQSFPLDVYGKVQHGKKAGDYVGVDAEGKIDAHGYNWPLYSGAKTPIFNFS